ncbi:MAG: DUF748 domain-containing protein [Nitrosomonas sp.]|nr:DUF748 domain-containing protein [Nitrosomonas sp.]
MTSTAQQRLIPYRRLTISLGVIVALIVLLVALSYLWLPGYAKSQLEIRLSEMLQRPVSVASIEIKLHRLELIVHGFRIGEKVDSSQPDQALFAFNRLYVDLSIESLKRRAPIITAISLTDPKLRLVRQAENQLNISDLLEKFAQPSEDKDDQGTKFSISNITIQGGYFEFDDQYMNADHQVTEINLGIPIIANFDSALTSWIEPHFSAKINGSPLLLNGKLRPFSENQEATLALKLSEFDLTQFDQYAPLPRGISLLSGHFNSDLLLTFAQASNKAPDITLTGSATLQGLSLKNSTVHSPYQASLKQLTLTLSEVDVMGEKPSQIKLNIDQVALTREGEKNPALSIAGLDADSVIVDKFKHQIALGEITLDRLNTTLRREASGDIDLTRLFSSTQDVQVQKKAKTKTQAQVQTQARIPMPGRKPTPVAAAEIKTTEKAAKSGESVSSASKEKSPAADAPWTTQIKRVKLKAAKLHYEDLTLTKSTPMIMDPLNITLDSIDLNGIKPLNLALQARVNQLGNIKMNGSLAWAPLSTDLTLDLNAVDLVSLQGWLGDKLTALLTSGDISFQGQVKAHGDPLKIQAKGNSKLANFNVFDAKNAQDLVRWKKLEINDINFTNEPMRIAMNTIHFGDFYARVTLLPDGNLNLIQIIQMDKPLEVEVSATDKAMEVKIATPVIEPTEVYQVKPKEETTIHIGKIYLQQGNINFNDRFVKPNYRANLTGLSGQIGPLAPNKSGKIDIRGAIDKIAPLEIHGSIDPFSADFLLDLTAKVKDIDLPPFSPYSGKYVGYAIEKGKLSMDVHYHVEKGALTAENKIFLDQFTLGDKIESEDAVSLPLNLALTLLKNRRGEIDIHLPLEGSINDPQFNVGALVFKAFINLITKAITSPFALLGAALEGGEELSEISFVPGFADIDADAAKRLEALAGILNDRPSLELEISGHIDSAQDYEGLKIAMLQDKVKAQKLTEQTKKGIASGAITDVTLTPEEYSKYLEMVYKKEEFDKPKNVIGLTKGLPSAEMEQLILANTQVNDNDLTALAERRANAARTWLVENGKIPDARVFVVGVHETKEDEQKKGSRAEFLLK